MTLKSLIAAVPSEVVMPPIGMLVGGLDFSQFAVTLKQAADGAPAVVIRYGAFLNTIIDFIIVAFAIFLVVKGMNSLRKRQEEAPAAPPPPSAQETLLAEIRDLLRHK